MNPTYFKAIKSFEQLVWSDNLVRLLYCEENVDVNVLFRGQIQEPYLQVASF